MEWIEQRAAGKPLSAEANETLRAELDELVATASFVERDKAILQRAIDRVKDVGASGKRSKKSGAVATDPTEDRTTDPDQSSGNLATQLGPVLQSFDAFAAEPLEWVWGQLIPRGKLTLITGEPGVGKSLFVVDVAAAVTRGDRGPHDESQHEPGAVILISAQDSLSDTIRPRLEAAGADLSRVFGLSNPSAEKPRLWKFRLDRDLPVLEAELLRLQDEGGGVDLLVIDPIASHWGSIEKDSLAVRLVSQLAELAERFGVAVMVVADALSTRARKMGSIRRTTGDEALATVARSAWMIAQDPGQSKRRFLLPIKTNLSVNRQGLAYEIGEEGTIEWETKSESLTAREFLLKSARRTRNRSGKKKGWRLARAVKWLRARLSTGPASANQIRLDSSTKEIRAMTLRRACIELGVKSMRLPGSVDCIWTLPEPEAEASPTPEQAQTKDVPVGS